MTTELESKAKALYEEESHLWTGIAWNWDEASEEVKKRFLLIADGAINHLTSLDISKLKENEQWDIWGGPFK